MNAVLYIHGKHGSATEKEHYEALFPDCAVIGLDYKTFTPRETGKEIRAAVESLKRKYADVTLVANSIGAFFSMHAGIDTLIQKSFFISPIVDMETLIADMLAWAGATENDLKAEGIIRTDFGETLLWEDLCYVRAHPIRWAAPTEILFGGNDNLTSLQTVTAFAEKVGARLTVMENGEHWFHTEAQMRFLDDWIRNSRFSPMEYSGESGEA